MRRRFRVNDIDWFLLGLALAIAAIGIVEIYSTTLHSPLAGQYKKQIYWLVLSCRLGADCKPCWITTWFWSKLPWLYCVSVFAFGWDFWWRATP